MIEYGDADVMIAGGAESTVSPLGVGGFRHARAVHAQRRSGDGVAPWDRTATGSCWARAPAFWCSRRTSTQGARRRIYAELVGFGMSGDAGHMTRRGHDGSAPRHGGRPGNAGLNADQVITSTPTAPRRRWGHQRIQRHQGSASDAARRAVVSSTKSMTGHLLGARRHRKRVQRAGPAPPEGRRPPSIFNQDPECDLDYCANTARDMRDRRRQLNNFGFGGTNGSLVLKRV